MSEVMRHAEDLWTPTEQGLWCPACGFLIADEWHTEDLDFESPPTCKQCGYPDFEDGPGYFTDDVP
jgi:hypothetical protein